MTLDPEAIRALEFATKRQRSAMVRRLEAEPEIIPQLTEVIIDEIARRMRTMKPADLVDAACDILKQSRLEKP